MVKAEQLFDNAEYDESNKIYRYLKDKFKKGTKHYEVVTDQVCLIYFQKRRDLRKQQKYEEAIEYLKEALSFIEQEKEYVRPFWGKENRYYFLCEIVMNYFSLKNYKAAKKYQFELYQMHYKDELPEKFKEYYPFDEFIWEGKNVLGYEYYEKLGDPKNSISFAKVVYEVAEIDENGNLGKFLFDLKVLKVHKRDPNDKNVDDYVLSKGIANSNELGGAIREFTYNRVIDYAKLKNDIMQVLNGNYQKTFKPN